MNPFALLIAVALGTAAVTSATAATATWKGGTPGVPDTWNISTNWISGTPPTGNDAEFPAAASFIGTMQNTDATVNSVAVKAAGYTFADSGIANGGLKVNAGGITVTFAGTGFATFNTPVRLDASQSWEMDGSRGTIRWNEPVNLNGKTLTITGSGVHEFQGGLTGTGNLLKSGAGRVEVNSAITGGGGCTVSEGTMEFNHATMSKTVNLVAPGTVAGAGTVASLVTTGGTVRPGGNLTGVLHVTGGIILNSTAQLDIEIDGANPGSGHDQLAGGTSVALNGAALNLTVEDGYLPLAGQPVRIVNNTGANPVTGTFAGLPEGSSIVEGSVTFRISYAGGADNNDVTLTPVAVAPTGIERVWTGNVDEYWSTPGNWAGNAVPQPGDNVQFPEVAADKKNANNNLPWGYPLHLVRLTAGGYVLSGFGLHLSDGIVQQAPAGAAANTVTFSFTAAALGSVTRVRLQAGGPLSFQPSFGYDLQHPASALVLQNDQPSVLLTSSVFAVGSGVIAKHGAGPVLLNSLTQHSGGVRVYAGTLHASVNGSLGFGVVGVDPGAVLELGKVAGTALNFTNVLDLGGTLRTAPGTPALTWSGPVQLQNSIDGHIETGGGQLTLSGAITGDGSGLTFSGSSAITLSGAAPNAYTEPTVITGVPVTCSKNGDNVTAIPGGVIVSGAGAVLHSGYANQIAPGASVSVTGGGIVQLGDHHTFHSLELAAGKVITTATLTITDGLHCLASGMTSEVTGNILTGGAPVAWQVDEGAAEPDLLFGGSLGHNGGAAAALTKTGAGTLRVLDAANSTHTDVTFTITHGGVEWNDLPSVPGPFGPHIVMNGGGLSGGGSVRDISVLAGTNAVSPGSGAGTMQCDNVTLRSNLTLTADHLPAGSDRLVVIGTVDPGNAQLALSGTPPPYGAPWTLIDNDGADPVNGAFSGLSEGGTIPFGNAMMQITYAGGDGNDVVLTRVPPPAPELTEFDLAGSIAGGGLPGAPPAVFTGSGLPHFSYALEISHDLEHWVVAVTASAGPDGGFKLVWNPPVIPDRRFFRVRAP